MFKKLLITVFSLALLANPSGANASSHAKSLQNLDMSEIMFAQMMIPHHKQAITMSDMAPAKSQNPEILKLAKQIKKAQGPEITQMTYWLKANNAGMVMDHDMAMSGMLTKKELANLKALSGKAFDRKFLESMIKHHQGAIEMLDLISNSDNAEVKALSKAIFSAQSKEIATMKQLLKKLK